MFNGLKQVVHVLCSQTKEKHDFHQPEVMERLRKSRYVYSINKFQWIKKQSFHKGFSFLCGNCFLNACLKRETFCLAEEDKEGSGS